MEGVGGVHLSCAREGSRGELAWVKVVVPPMIGGRSWNSGMAVRREEAPSEVVAGVRSATSEAVGRRRAAVRSAERSEAEEQGPRQLLWLVPNTA
jgi:hypothetical protein